MDVTVDPNSFLQLDLSVPEPGNLPLTLSWTIEIAGERSTVSLVATPQGNVYTVVPIVTGVWFGGHEFTVTPMGNQLYVLQFAAPLQWTVTGDMETLDIGVEGEFCNGPCVPRCEPLPDGSDCEPIVCPGSNELCRPTVRVFDPVSDSWIVTRCDCVDSKQCYVELSQTDPPSATCRGLSCPAVEPCELRETHNPADGTITYTCCPCLQPPEACCIVNEFILGCQMLDPQCCIESGGSPKGSGSVCQGDNNGNGVDDTCEPCASCCGTVPQFAASSTPGPWAFMTFNSTNNVVVGFNLGGQSASTPMGCPAWTPPNYVGVDWTRAKLGSVFGITLDDLGNIYVAHTAIYKVASDAFGGLAPAGKGPGAIYKIDNSGAAGWFATLPNPQATSSGIIAPNNYPGLGNICFDCATRKLYATNWADGGIYRLNTAGNILSCYHHATNTLFPGGNCTDLDPLTFAPLGERVWAVQTSRDKLYYSVYWQDESRPGPANEIWSIGISATTGQFIPPAQLVLTLPPLPNGTPCNPTGVYSNPVADISFKPDCCMLLAERSMDSDTTSDAHRSRLLEYCPDPATGIYAPSTTNFFSVGRNTGNFCGSNSAGGTDFDFDPSSLHQVLATGDILTYQVPSIAPFCTPSPYIYGLQVLQATGGTAANSFLIDSDLDASGPDKYQQGDVEISCPPPPLCPTPRPPVKDICGLRQPLDCRNGLSSESCLPARVEIIQGPELLYASASDCACFEPGPCGPISVDPLSIDCLGNCPSPGICQPFVNGVPRGKVSLYIPGLTPGDVITCDCPGCETNAGCSDGLFCNGEEQCGTAGQCGPGEPPCLPDQICDENADVCRDGPIPTVSVWGLVVLTLLLLIGAKIYFARRETVTAT